MEEKRLLATHKGKIQIQVSKGNMDHTIRESTDRITSIKLRNEREEKERRIEDEEKRVKRFADIQAESITASKKIAALELKWNELKNLDECEELFNKIEDQKKFFNRIKDGKDKLIDEFWEELNKKDDDYRQMMKSQENDIHEIVIQMRGQFSDLREKYLFELEEIEKEFSNERTALMESQKKDLDGVFDNHLRLEQNWVDKRDNTEEKYTQAIEELRIKGAKTYADLKLNLETEIQNLEKCLEDMKALYQLNQEKLDYNLKVLKEKHEENQHLSDELKRKDQMMTNRLRKLTKDYADADKNYKTDNKNLTSEYKRITRQFKELQRKFKHFEKADLDRYTEIHKMNEAEVKAFKKKLIKCNITIHIQQLGMACSPNDELLMEELHNLENEEEEKEIGQNQTTENNVEVQPDQQDQKNEIPIDVDEPTLREMLDMLLEETEFLLDDKVREQLKDMKEVEKIGGKLEILKKALQIDSIEEINQLFQKLDEKQKALKLKKIIAGESNLNFDSNDMIDLRNDIVEILTDFMKTKNERKKALELQATKKPVKQETEREKKERIAREGKKYWEKFSQILPEETFRVWKMLDQALSKYYQLLLDRQKLIDETGDLHNQNEELKKLLNQYLQINHELIIPPTRMIKLDQKP